MPDAAIHTVVRILEKLGPVLYRGELPNGKIILAHLSKPMTRAGREFATESRVIVELTPFDFDQGRIIDEA
jgi:translation initiation factor IF-1